jgi:Mrp family chromosome partitioning ATPase
MTRGEFPGRAAAVAVLAFLPFVAYAYLSTPTYAATAQIFVEAPANTALPPVEETARRLRETGLDPEVLARIGRELGFDASAASEALLRERLRQQLSLNGAAGGVYDVTFVDSDAARAALLCNLIAQRAAARATHGLFSDERARAELTKEKSARQEALAAFVRAHPEVAAPPAASAEAAARASAETQATKLRSERDLLQARLDAAGPEETTDNPYEEPSVDPERQRLGRRIREIEGELSRLSRRPDAPPAPRVEPEVEREWRRLSAAAAEAVEPTLQTEVLRVRLAQAIAPSVPLHPNRRLILLIGAVAAILGAIVFRSIGRKRDEPRATPASDENALSSVVPTRLGNPALQRSSVPPAEARQRSSAPPEASQLRQDSDPPYQPSRPPPATKEAEAVLAEAMLGPRGYWAPSAPRQEAVPEAQPVAAAPEAIPLHPAPFEAPPITERLEPAPAVAPAAPVEPVAAAPAADQTPAGPPPTLTTEPRPNRTLTGFAPVPAVRMLMTPLPERPDEPEQDLHVPPQRTPIVIEETVEAVASVEWDPPGREDPNRPRKPSRTTQSLGSYMPPDVRSHTPIPSAPEAHAPRTAPGQGYLSTPPPPMPLPRRHLSTPPYYGDPPRARQAPSDQPVARHSPAPLARAAIRAHPVHSAWAPNPALRLETRRALSDELFPYAVEGCFVIGVTGVPDMRAQKTHVAAELALALAEARRPRVLLLEGDFQWPGLHQVLRIEMPLSKGFSQQLRSRRRENDDWTVVECAPSLHVLAEGLMRSPGMILSRHFEDGLESFRSYYDFVVVSGPLSSSEIDCRALDSVVDGVVMVSPEDGSPWLKHALSLFPEKRYSTIVGMA